jgi:phage shock protein PspC (stress-responsive transcriptional regulator)
MSASPRSRPEQVPPASPQSGGIRGALARAGLSRPWKGAIIAGVAAGLGRRLGVSAWLVRGVFIASLLLPGPQFLVYAALWILMPRDA